MAPTVAALGAFVDVGLGDCTVVGEVGRWRAGRGEVGWVCSRVSVGQTASTWVSTGPDGEIGPGMTVRADVLGTSVARPSRPVAGGR